MRTGLGALVNLMWMLGAFPVGAEVSEVGGGFEMKEPFSVVFAEDGTMYAVEYEAGNRVLKISPDGKTVTVIAGKPGKGGKQLGDVAEGDGEPAVKARFNGMHDLALAPDGKIYIADTFNNRVRVVDLGSGTVETFAGRGGKGGFGGDGGPAKEARFNGPYTVSLSPDAKRLLVADLGNRRVREIEMRTKIIRTVAGNGRRGIPRNGGTANREPLVAPRAACYGADGKTIYIASREGHALREVSPEGRIRTVVNASGAKGYGGDGGPGFAAKMNGPKHLCLDPKGDIVIADDQNHCLRLYRVKAGMINLLAGIPGMSGKRLGTGPMDTLLNRPHGARYDAAGNLFVADSMNHRILKFGER